MDVKYSKKKDSDLMRENLALVIEWFITGTVYLHLT